MSQTTIPRAAVRGTAAGVIFMAFFGTLWAGIGIRGMQGWAFFVLIILSLLIGVILFIGAIVLIKKSSLLSNEVIKKDKEHWRKKNIWFGIIFSLEGLLIAITSFICTSFPVKTIINDHHIMVWWVSLGFGSALILWGTGVIVCFRGFRLISMAQNVADNGKWS
jgi:MFS family permease